MKIIDEFTNLKVSRQFKYMLRQNKKGLCRLCPEKAVSGGFCLKHLVQKRERTRTKIQAVKRHNSISYKLEAEAKKRKRTGS